MRQRQPRARRATQRLARCSLQAISVAKIVGIITHFTHRHDWDNAVESGFYTAPSLETQGFIHCSTPEQVTGVADRIARTWDDTVLIWIDEAKVEATITYENLEGGVALFPHIYGPLSLDAVIGVTPFPKNEKGEYELPQT